MTHGQTSQRDGEAPRPVGRHACGLGSGRVRPNGGDEPHGGHRGPELSWIGDELDRTQLIVRINNGGYNMPAFASSLTSSELSEIVDFLLTRRAKTTK